MIRFFLLILGIFVILALAAYAVSLIVKVRKQVAIERQLRQQAEAEQKARFGRIIESLDIIARAMLAEQCDFSEGVLRLKPLMDVLGEKLERYPAMWELYLVVENMPILEARKQLKRNERMRLDLDREAKEAELSEQIKQECTQLIADLKTFNL